MKNRKPKVADAGVSILFICCFALLSFSYVSDLSDVEVKNEIYEVERPSIAPVDISKATIGDGYGERIHPVTQEKKMHTGIDFIMAHGESVIATSNGVVVEAGNDEYRGSYVIVKHNKVYTTSYAHLKSAVVKAGDTIKKKQLLGYVGSTGKVSAGPHLHYEVFKDGQNVNPVDYLPKSRGAK